MSDTRKYSPITLRPYQEEAAAAAVRYMRRKSRNGVIVVPTGGGKSVIICEIAKRLGGNVLVFQPSMEILKQNYAKYEAVDPDGCAVFSASMGSKDIASVTFATIGTAVRSLDEFRRFEYIIIDECHTVNADGGMYERFISAMGRPVLGLTATPYRLSGCRVSDFVNGSIIRMITRTRPRIFSDIVYCIQISQLCQEGYLAPLRYFPIKPSGFEQGRLRLNTTGRDYTDASVLSEYRRCNFYGFLADVVERLKRPKQGGARRGILVFTRFLEEAHMLACTVDGCRVVDGKMDKKKRAGLLEEFKSGAFPVLVNVGVLTTGFDYPELDTIVIARPTRSLAMYYQIVGRALRPHRDKKEAWIVDLCGTVERFGRVEDLTVTKNERGMADIYSNGRKLTGVVFT